MKIINSCEIYKTINRNTSYCMLFAKGKWQSFGISY